MKNIMVTGGSGFIGSNFVHYVLKSTNYQGRIINFDSLTYAGNACNHEEITSRYPERYIFVHGDIRDPDQVAHAIEAYDIDTICHFAAESHVDRSIASPNAFLQTNVFGTFNLLEATRMRPEQIDRFHHVSTDEVYGSLGETGFFTEDTPYHPNNPYSASKAASDHLVQAYCNTYKLPVTISNCSNNYGPYQFPEKLIPLVILNALESAPIPVYGTGKNVRDWLYVGDHCDAIWTILKKGKLGETYNVGGHEERTNLEVVQKICSTLQTLLSSAANQQFSDLITFVPDRQGHDWRYAIDSTKIENELGWKPSLDFDSGIVNTIQWYLTHQEWIDQVRSGEYRNWIQDHYDGKFSSDQPNKV